ncbi:MAG: TGS domain-containing protein, partial [Bacteroidales bacterium]|nr:TGS domain-containing protein [Bacteroidales bacterium]
MSTKKIDIFCVNTGITKQYSTGITLKEIAEDQEITLEKAIVGAKVNNAVKELDYTINKPKVVEFFTIESIDGQKMYQRSLCFILAKAVNDVDENLRVHIDHSISKGFYC